MRLAAPEMFAKCIVYVYGLRVSSNDCTSAYIMYNNNIRAWQMILKTQLHIKSF